MDKKIYYCLPTYKSFDLAHESVLAAMRGTLPPDNVIIIDNSGDGSGTRYLQPLVEKYSNVFIWPQTYNIGVAKSWNTFHQTIGEDYIIIANDDIKVHSQTIEKIVYQAEQNKDEIFFCGDGNYGNAYSLFLLTKRGFDLVGIFDERYYPAYFEDRDHHYRMLKKGYNLRFVTGAGYDHVGSSTIKKYTPQEMDLHHNSFRSNEAYYIQKWGGVPHNEIFETAFDK